MARSVDCVLNVQKQEFSVTVQPPVLCPVVSPVRFVQERQSQKKNISPSLKTNRKIKFVKGVSIVDHCVFAKTVPTAPNVAGGRSSPTLLADMVPPGRISEGSVNFERRLHSSIQNKTPTSERPSDNQWLCKPRQEPLPEGGFACTDQEAGSREGKGSDLSSLLQQIVHCPQSKPEMAANLGPQCSKPNFGVLTYVTSQQAAPGQVQKVSYT